MNQRRSFIKKISILSAVTISGGIFQPAWSRNLKAALKDMESAMPLDIANDEDFWGVIRQSFTLADNFINLNNAGVSPAPKPVAEAMKLNYDIGNQGHSMRRDIEAGRDVLRKSLAQLAGCSTEEIALHRNTTEGLETVIFGLDLQPDDEVVLSKQDYPAMICAWKQREKRDKIKLVWVDLKLPSEDDNYLTQQYVNAFTNKTKLVQITQMINWTGQKIPVRKIADQARKKNIEVLVDGAQSFAQYQFTIQDLNCDYFGTSLHKWLGAPIGTGFLYVRKEKIKQIWPLFGAIEGEESNIRKFEHLGVRPFFIEQAVDKAIDFHEMIGIERKEERLRFLSNYWMERVKNISKVRLHTSFKPEYACAIGLVSIEGKKVRDFNNFLSGKYRIHAIDVDLENIQGLRISPNVYTSTKNLDRLVEAITEFAKI